MTNSDKVYQHLSKNFLTNQNYAALILGHRNTAVVHIRSRIKENSDSKQSWHNHAIIFFFSSTAASVSPLVERISWQEDVSLYWILCEEYSPTPSISCFSYEYTSRPQYTVQLGNMIVMFIIPLTCFLNPKRICFLLCYLQSAVLHFRVFLKRLNLKQWRCNKSWLSMKTWQPRNFLFYRLWTTSYGDDFKVWIGFYVILLKEILVTLTCEQFLFLRNPAQEAAEKPSTWWSVNSSFKLVPEYPPSTRPAQRFYWLQRGWKISDVPKLGMLITTIQRNITQMQYWW